MVLGTKDGKDIYGEDSIFDNKIKISQATNSVAKAKLPSLSLSDACGCGARHAGFNLQTTGEKKRRKNCLA